MSPTPRDELSRFDQRYLIGIVIVVAVVVFVITWVGIRESRDDSYRLLVRQGSAFTAALAEASQNAITAESFYDRLVQRRYADLIATLQPMQESHALTVTKLADFIDDHDLFGVYVFSIDSLKQTKLALSAGRPGLPAFVEQEVKDLAGRMELRFVQLLDEDKRTGDKIQYYCQVTDDLAHIYVIASDARAYNEALDATGIGYLAQRMAREEGVEYIIYQATDGIVFASREPGKLLAIESDSFLTQALDTDTASSRIFEFQGRRVLEIVHPFSTEDNPKGLFRVGLSLRGYYSVSRGFDQQMIVLSVVLFGLIIAVVLYVNSRRKRHELSREYSHIKSLTDRIFEQMRTGVAVIDDAGFIRMANDAFERSFNVRQIIDRPWNDTIRVPDLSTTSLLSSDQTVGEKELTILVDKEARILLVGWSKLYFEDTNGTAIVLVVYNITRYRQYEQEATRRERLSEMGNLAAGVAHEIRNPLNTISIAAQRLAAEFTPAENADEYLKFTQSIRSETKRLNDIITRFLALAREEQQHRQQVNLKKAVDDFLALISTEAQRLGINIEAAVDPSLAIEANPDALRQVLLNLYNNSKEALAGQPGKMRITGRWQDDSMVITFEDSGPGIPLELRDKVFTPYFTTKEAGTGLGLPTVHRIVSEMGGTVKAGESPLGGVAFTVLLPGQAASA